MESGSLQHQEANNLTISAFMVLVSTGNFANLSPQCFSTGPLHPQLSSYRFTYVFILLSQNHPYCFLLYSKFFYFLKQSIWESLIKWTPSPWVQIKHRQEVRSRPWKLGRGQITEDTVSHAKPFNFIGNHWRSFSRQWVYIRPVLYPQYLAVPHIIEV